MEIVHSALDSHQKTVGDGHIRRARKALTDLAIFMLDDRGSGSVFSHPNRSLGGWRGGPGRSWGQFRFKGSKILMRGYPGCLVLSYLSVVRKCRPKKKKTISVRETM